MASSDQRAGDSPDRSVVIVVGPGRSGTSTIAGALAKSGFEVPGRAIGGNETNPSGFFEPRWVVDLHRDLLERAHVATMDATPDAVDAAARVAADPAVRKTLHDWLAERLEEQPRLVVKDPRTVWFRDLWADTCQSLDVTPSFITMLRHPAEVSASRQKYYSGAAGDTREADIRRVAGWTNVALIAEQISRGFPRAFVHYTDLVGDWRSALARVGEECNLTYDPPIDSSPHPVDEFIDPSLHRVHVDWEDTDIPAALRDVAQLTWSALADLAKGPGDEAAVARVQAAREDYGRLTGDAMALSQHAVRRLEAKARRRERRRVRKDASAPKDDSAPSRLRSGRALWRRLTRSRA